MPAKRAPLHNTLTHFLDREPGTELEGARLLPLDLVDANPQQSRQVFDEAALDELAQSIREHGVLEPILLRPDGNRYQVVAGERRTRAARLAGLAAIPAIIREMTNEEAAYATAIENLQRADLDLEDEARWFAYLRDLTGLSGRELARRLGKGYNYVNRRLALLDRPDLLARVRAGELTQREALEILTHGEEAVIHGVSDPGQADGVIHGVSGETERAALDAGTRGPGGFRWRPWQQFAAVVAKTHATDVPAAERATFRAQVAQLRAELEALEAELGEE